MHYNVPRIIVATLIKVLHSMNQSVMLLCVLQFSPSYWSWSNIAISTALYESCSNAAMCTAMFDQLLKWYHHKYCTLWIMQLCCCVQCCSVWCCYKYCNLWIYGNSAICTAIYPNYWSNTTTTALCESCSNSAICTAMLPQLLKQYRYYCTLWIMQ